MNWLPLWIACGLLTFTIRYSFIALEGHYRPPAWFVRWLPFVPIAGTPLEHHPAPSTDFMVEVYTAVGGLLEVSDLSSAAMTAGCAKCGACSALSLFESSETIAS